MYKWIIGLLFLMGYTTTEAHQPDLSSTILMEQGDNKWVLQVRAALTAFEYEIEQHFGAAAYTSPEEFQALLAQYVADNISMEWNGIAMVNLQNAVVNLGHETKVSYEVVGLPKNIQSLKVENTSFSDIARNQSALIVVKKGFPRNQFILNNDNRHAVELEVINASFALMLPRPIKTWYYLLALLGMASLLTLLHFIYKDQQTKNWVPVPLGTA